MASPIINPMGQQAAALYQNTAKMGNIVTSSPSGADDDKISFGSLFRAGLEEVISTQKKSEEMSAKAVTGQANMVDLVEATTEAEVVLKMAKAVRDRVIDAYSEIMRMPV